MGAMILAGVEYTFPASPWVIIFGPLSMILGVCASLLVPLRSQLCFLDMTSIHQSDPKLLERGIYSIGGFLSVSKELRVLYTPPYFTSLWLNSTESRGHSFTWKLSKDTTKITETYCKKHIELCIDLLYLMTTDHRWCLFEMVAFRTSNPAGKMTFLPLPLAKKNLSARQHFLL